MITSSLGLLELLDYSKIEEDEADNPRYGLSFRVLSELVAIHL